MVSQIGMKNSLVCVCSSTRSILQYGQYIVKPGARLQFLFQRFENKKTIKFLKNVKNMIK